MNVLITGGSGFIASQIIADLLLAGHQVTCCARNTKPLSHKFPMAKMLRCDFTKTDQQFWEQALESIDAVINCAGILSSFSKKKIWKIHFDAPKKLFEVVHKKNIKHLVQISALGIEQSKTEFAKSKKALDDFLIEQKIPCVIVRPSLVYAHGSYGGTSLFRGLSALPWVLPIPGKGKQTMQPINLKDLSKSVVEILVKENNEAKIVYAVGPEQCTIKKILIDIRNWLGFKSAKIINVPIKFLSLFISVFDSLRSPTINSTTLEMLNQNNVVSKKEQQQFFNMINFVPQKFSNTLLANPSYVQDRWHAKLYFLRPILRYSIAFVWLAGAYFSWAFPVDKSFELLAQAHISKFLQPIFFYGSISIDFLLGILTLINYKIKTVGLFQCLLILFYSVIIALFLPQWWVHPFGPMIKNIPLFIAILVMMALEDNR